MKRYRAKRLSEIEVNGNTKLVHEGRLLEFNPDDFEEVEEEKEIEPLTEAVGPITLTFKFNEVIKVLNQLQKQVKEIKEDK